MDESINLANDLMAIDSGFGSGGPGSSDGLGGGNTTGPNAEDGEDDEAQEKEWSKEDCDNLLSSLQRRSGEQSYLREILREQEATDLLGQTFSLFHSRAMTGAQYGSGGAAFSRVGLNYFRRVRAARRSDFRSPYTGQRLSDVGPVAAQGARNQLILEAANVAKVEAIEAGVVALTFYSAGEMWKSFADAARSGRGEGGTLDISRNVLDQLQTDYNSLSGELDHDRSVYRKNCMD